MALAMMPGRRQRQRDGGEGAQGRGADVARRELEVAVDGREGRGGDPDRIDEAVRRMHEHDAR